MNEPLLSICIPTYNRVIFLKRTCALIFAQADEENLGRLEICISDNASTDNTRIVVNDFLMKYPQNVRYKINDKNYGTAYNIFEVLKMAHGEYLWCIGDDDIFIDGAIPHLFKLITRIKNDPEIRVVFGKFNSGAGNKVAFRGFGALQSERIYTKMEVGDYFIKDKFWSNGFLGAHIFHKDIVKDYFANLGRQDNCSSWPHLSLLLHSFKTLKKVIVSQPIIYQTGDGLYWLRANWILVLFHKVEVIDMALLREEITEHMATKICSSTLFSFELFCIGLAAKIEEPERFLSVTKKILAYKSSNRHMQLRINIFKLMLRIINSIPFSLLKAVYLFYIKLSGRSVMLIEKNNPAYISKNKREGMSAENLR